MNIRAGIHEGHSAMGIVLVLMPPPEESQVYYRSGMDSYLDLSL